MNDADRKALLKAINELKCVHQGIGSVGARWRRCRNPNSKMSKRYEKAHDEMSRRGHELSDEISMLIQLQVPIAEGDE